MNSAMINAMLGFVYELDTYLDDEQFEAEMIEDHNRRQERFDKVNRLRKANGILTIELMKAKQQYTRELS